MPSADDTIAAIASASGGAARGILRISGRQAIAVATNIFHTAADCILSEIRRPTAVVGAVEITSASCTPIHRRELPCTLYAWPTARSYTREPLVELHTLGSPPLLAALLRQACSDSARMAEPGEFTLRAFLAGRLDLTQAEAVLGVIDAADRRQLDAALAQLAGGLSGRLTELRDELLNLLADVEAGLDFTEEDIQFVSGGELQSRLASAAEHVERLLAQMKSRGRAEQEPRVALVGWPNSGKSSLFNALLGRSAAIVSEQAGTTRDYLRATLPIGGISCQLIDTAGRELNGSNGDVISTAAQQMTAEQHQAADLRLLCIDATRKPNAWERTPLESGSRQIVVLTKCDASSAGGEPDGAVATSAVTGRGLDELKAAIRARLGNLESATAVAATAERCHECLRLALASLGRADQLAVNTGGEELIAAELRAALVELGKVVGTIYTDDILDRIFSRFCIGK
jgi:tRNA modification GTPase